MTVLGFDRSHYNAEPDFAAFKAGGGALVGCKATDGVGWSDPSFSACRAGTHAAGLVLIPYHFAEWGDPVAEARWYLQVANLVPGDVPALDAEAAVPAGVDVVAWSLTWCQMVHAACAAWPLIYMNQSWATSHNWAPVAANDGLWLAKYDNVPTGSPLGAWQTLALKQYTDAGTVPGEAGLVDADAFQGDLAALLRYAVPSSPVGGFLMSLSDGDQARLLANTDLLVQQLMGPGYTVGQAAAAPGWPGWRYGSPSSQTVVDMLRSIDRQTGSLLNLDGRPLDPAHVDNELGQVLSLRAEVAELLTRPAAGIDQAGADLIAAALVANADFQRLIAQAAATVVSAEDADLAKRFGTTA